MAEQKPSAATPIPAPSAGKDRAILTAPIEQIVQLQSIWVPPHRARKDYRGIRELADSIKDSGLIHPLYVKKLPTPIPPGLPCPPDKSFELIAGGRRLRACDLILNWETIPVRVVPDDFDDLDMKVAELVENISREALTPAEECENLRQIDQIMRQKFGSGGKGSGGEGWTNTKTAELVGQSRQSVDAKIKHATLLDQRPDLKNLTKDMPLVAAIKLAEDKVRTESLVEQHNAGTLSINQHLRNVDALLGIKEIPDNSINLHLTDPPFGLTEVNDALGTVMGESSTYTAFLKDTDNMDTKSVRTLLEGLVPELYRTSTPGGHIYMFCSMEIFHLFLLDLLRSVGYVCPHQPLIWYKERPTTQFRGYDFPSAYEPIIFGIKPPERKLINPKLSNVLSFKPVSSTAKTHRFQKPQELLRALIDTSTYTGETVLDCFAGSGATLLAARTLKRNAIGFEINKENYVKAQIFLQED